MLHTQLLTMPDRRSALSERDMPTVEPWPITATVERFCELSGLGKTSAKELIRAGALRSVKIMGRRLIIMESYRELVRQAELAE